jgi:hypothetical protein
MDQIKTLKPGRLTRFGPKTFWREIILAQKYFGAKTFWRAFSSQFWRALSQPLLAQSVLTIDI